MQKLCSKHQRTEYISTCLVLTAFYRVEIHSIQLLIYSLHIYVPKYFSVKTSIWPISPKQRSHDHTGVIHFITDQGSSRRYWGCGRTDRLRLSRPMPQAGLMLVMHLPYGNYNLATQNSGPAAFSSGLAASVFLYNL